MWQQQSGRYLNSKGGATVIDSGLSFRVGLRDTTAGFRARLDEGFKATDDLAVSCAENAVRPWLLAYTI